MLEKKKMEKQYLHYIFRMLTTKKIKINSK